MEDPDPVIDDHYSNARRVAIDRHTQRKTFGMINRVVGYLGQPMVTDVHDVARQSDEQRSDVAGPHAVFGESRERVLKCASPIATHPILRARRAGFLKIIPADKRARARRHGGPAQSQLFRNDAHEIGRMSRNLIQQRSVNLG